MDKTILIEKTSKRLKRWELIVTAALFLTFLTGFGTLYIAIPLAIAVWRFPGCASLPLSQSVPQSGGITDKFKQYCNNPIAKTAI